MEYTEKNQVEDMLRAEIRVLEIMVKKLTELLAEERVKNLVQLSVNTEPVVDSKEFESIVPEEDVEEDLDKEIIEKPVKFYVPKGSV